MGKATLLDFLDDIRGLVNAAEELSNQITDNTYFRDGEEKTFCETLDTARECVFEKIHATIRRFENSIEYGTEETAR